jgi:UDP-N-acetylmuramoyl-tripeptide--D-alanyl-D-alanine ligase
MLTLADALEALTTFRPQTETVITEAVIDSRQVIPGSLFVAIPGQKLDGHDFIGEAFRRGASFTLTQREVDDSFRIFDLRTVSSTESYLGVDFSIPLCLRVDNTVAALQKIARFWRRKLNIRMIGITGSVGKSTTKEMVAEVLSTRYHTLKSPGNLNNEIGLPLSMTRLGSGYQHAVMEMGFYVPGEISFLCDIALPQIGVVTNIGTVHAERARSQEAIARGKANWFKPCRQLQKVWQFSILMIHGCERWKRRQRREFSSMACLLKPISGQTVLKGLAWMASDSECTIRVRH